MSKLLCKICGSKSGITSRHPRSKCYFPLVIKSQWHLFRVTHKRLVEKSPYHSALMCIHVCACIHVYPCMSIHACGSFPIVYIATWSFGRFLRGEGGGPKSLNRKLPKFGNPGLQKFIIRAFFGVLKTQISVFSGA